MCITSKAGKQAIFCDLACFRNNIIGPKSISFLKTVRFSPQVKDALLLAISEQYVEGVELLLQHEERTHVNGQPYSWEAVDTVSANYTPDITPLILVGQALKSSRGNIRMCLFSSLSRPRTTTTTRS